MARPLVMRIGALGDTVMTIPLIRALAEAYGEPCDVVGHTLWAPLVLRGLPFVGEVRSIGSTKMPLWLNPQCRSLRRWLRQRGDGPVLLGEQRELIHRLSAGVAGPRHSIRDLPPLGRSEHQIEILLRLGAQTGRLDPGAAVVPPQLPVADEELAAAKAYIAKAFPQGAAAPLLCLQLGSNATLRRGAPDRASNDKWWPLERWVAVLRALRTEHPRLRVLATGSASESAVVQSLIAAAPEIGIVDGTGTTLEQLKARLSCATLLLSVDTGVAHVAAAVSCPCVVLFGRGDPRVNHPWSAGAAVTQLYGPPDAPEPLGEAGWAAHHAITEISVERVIAAVRERLQQSAS